MNGKRRMNELTKVKRDPKNDALIFMWYLEIGVGVGRDTLGGEGTNE